MTEVTNIRVEIMGDQNPESSHWLQTLRSDLEQELEVTIDVETIKAPVGSMAIDIITGIAIASLTFSAINTVLMILEHRRKRNNRSSVTITGEKYSYTLSELNDDERRKILRDLEENKLKNVIIKVNN